LKSEKRSKLVKQERWELRKPPKLTKNRTKIDFQLKIGAQNIVVGSTSRYALSETACLLDETAKWSRTAFKVKEQIN
jgi:hypothetical protein